MATNNTTIPQANPADFNADDYPWTAEDHEALCQLGVMLYEALDPEARERFVDELMACHPDNKQAAASA